MCETFGITLGIPMILFSELFTNNPARDWCIPVIASSATAAGAAERQDGNSRGWSAAEPHRHEVKEIFEFSVENNVLKAGTLIFANLP
jgi:hypothetical protein